MGKAANVGGRTALHAGGKTTLARAVSAAVMATALGAPAFGQSLEEVVVTATKRSESVQDVPLAITALSGDFVNKVNLNDVKDLVSYTPGITGNSQDSFIDAISVRGVRTQDFGVGGDPSAAFFKNDLYEGRNGSAVTSLYDIERAEILRGPQGFLFGRNSIGGAVSVHTRKAEIGSSDGYVDLDVGERNHGVAEGAINLPMGDTFAMRLAGYYSTEDGFAKNVFDGDDVIEHDKWALRWSTAFEAHRLSVNTLVEYEDREQSGSMYRAIDEGDIWEAFDSALGGVTLGGSDEDIDSDRTVGDDDTADILTLGLAIDYDLDFATLTSNTGYKDHDYYYSEDYDGTPLNINNYQQDQTGDYFQQELRLTSNTEGPLSWYAGVSYYKESIDAKFGFIGEEDFMCQYYGAYYNAGMTFSGCEDLYAYYGSSFSPAADGLLRETGRIKGDYSGWATYVNLDYYITDNFDVEVGVRYTDDEKDFALSVPTPESELGPYWAYGFSTDGFISDTQSWDDTTLRVMAKYRPTDDMLLFASFTEGFKSGGFGSFNLGNNAAGEPAIGNTDLVQADGFLPNQFDPETVDSWEVGYKDSWFNGNANVDLTAFYYEYQDLQVVIADGGAALVENVGEVESWGVEGSLTTRLSEYFEFYLALSYLDAEATELQSICGLEDPNGCEGSRLFWAPEWSGAAVLDGRYPLSGGYLTGSLEVFWESERGGGWEDLSETKIDDYAESALRVGYESNDNWYVQAYVENLTDEFTWDGQNNNGGLVPSHFFGPKRPRTFGMRVGLSWE
ncbi:TonB-dependent receptor [Parahaliea mediterranea]|uniref:TonB-dependent receptor n=1 Tax=Parahaliea mediterranea TaxID=651086 RepID=UPI001F4EE00D|nr:TonB-dependent receptor [Parahaliea mediterranea]